MMRVPAPTTRTFILAVAAIATAVGVALVVTKSSTSTRTPKPHTRTELCRDVDRKAIHASLQPEAVLTVTDDEHCTLTIPGTGLDIRAEQQLSNATEKDFETVKRSSGPTPDDQTQWPSSNIPNLGQQAKWLEDPNAKGRYGELYILHHQRLVAITAATPPNTPIPAKTYATETAKILLENLE